MLANSSAKVQSHFYPGDLVTCTGDREIRSVSGRVGMYACTDHLECHRKTRHWALMHLFFLEALFLF